MFTLNALKNYNLLIRFVYNNHYFGKQLFTQVNNFLYNINIIVTEYQPILIFYVFFRWHWNISKHHSFLFTCFRTHNDAHDSGGNIHWNIEKTKTEQTNFACKYVYGQIYKHDSDKEKTKWLELNSKLKRSTREKTVVQTESFYTEPSWGTCARTQILRRRQKAHRKDLIINYWYQ